MKNYMKTVSWFTTEMEKKLELNKHKTGWRSDGFDSLFKRLKEETLEMRDAIHTFREGPRLLTEVKNKNLDNIVAECADIANFAMMIADNAERLKIEMDAE